MVAQLKSDTVQAVASCDAMPLKDPLTGEAVEHTVDSLKADSVLPTRLVSLKSSKQEGGGRDTRGGGYYKATDSGYATGMYGGYAVPVIYGEFQTAPTIQTVDGEIQVASSFYEVRGNSLIDTLTTKVEARDVESRASGLAIVAAPIAQRLRRDRLIQ